MDSKELFIVGLRLFGVWLLLRLIDDAIAAFDFTVGFAYNPNSSVYACYTHGSVYLVVGLYFLSGAPQIVHFFYPPVPAPVDPDKPPITPGV